MIETCSNLCPAFQSVCLERPWSNMFERDLTGAANCISRNATALVRPFPRAMRGTTHDPRGQAGHTLVSSLLWARPPHAGARMSHSGAFTEADSRRLEGWRLRILRSRGGWRIFLFPLRFVQPGLRHWEGKASRQSVSRPSAHGQGGRQSRNYSTT